MRDSEKPSRMRSLAIKSCKIPIKEKALSVEAKDSLSGMIQRFLAQCSSLCPYTLTRLTIPKATLKARISILDTPSEIYDKIIELAGRNGRWEAVYSEFLRRYNKWCEKYRNLLLLEKPKALL